MKNKFLLWPLAAVIAVHVALLLLSGCRMLDLGESRSRKSVPPVPAKTNAAAMLPPLPPLPPTNRPAVTPGMALRRSVASIPALAAVPGLPAYTKVENFATFKFFMSPTNCTFSIQRSSNLVNWIEIARMPGGGDGWRSFVDLNTDPVRYYRIIRF